MTSDDLWRAVGEALLLQRTRRRWDVTDVQAHGGPNYKTVQAIERGDVGNVSKLEAHAAAFGLSIVDILRSVLEADRERLSPEAYQVLRAFERTTVAGRHAIVSMIQVLPDAAAAPPDTPESPRDTDHPVPHTR